MQRPSTPPTLADALARVGALDAVDRRYLDALQPEPRALTQGQWAFWDGTASDRVMICTRGWLATTATLHDGRESLISFHLPGDLLADTGPVAGAPRHAARALTAAQVTCYPAGEVRAMMRARPAVADAFLAHASQQQRAAQERVRMLVMLNAYERLAHFCLDMLDRLERAGLASNDTFVMPINQPTLGRYLGIHEVHVNRTLKRLENDGQIRRTQGRIEVLHRAALARAVDFQPVEWNDDTP